MQFGVLFVAFHFPPQSGSSGVLRTLNFVRNFHRSGWSVGVLSVNPVAYAQTSQGLLESVPSQIRVVRAWALDASRHLAWRGRWIGALGIPDRWSSWVPAGIVAGCYHILKQRPKLIHSTYPIASAHCVALVLSRLFGIPWIADFRDPMTANLGDVGPWHRRILLGLERRFLKAASASVFTSSRARDEVAVRFPELSHRFHVIENGYDEEAFEGLMPQRMGAAEHKLLLLHSGHLYPRDRDPGTFLAAVRELIDAGIVPRNRLHIRFRAPGHAEEVIACAQAHTLEDVVEVAPPIEYRQALSEMMAADLLLVFQGARFNAQIPAKIYEYLRARGDLFAVLDPQGDTAAKLARFEQIGMADINSTSDITRALRQWLSEVNQPENAQRQARNRAAVSQFSRRAQSQQLQQLAELVLREREAP